MKNIVVFSTRFKIEIYTIVLVVLFYLFRPTFPLLKYPFVLSFSIFLIYTIVKFKLEVLRSFFLDLKKFSFQVVLVLILIVSFLSSNKIYLSIFKDSINAIILLFIFFIMTLYIKKKSDLSFFLNSLINLFVFFALLISIFRLGNLFNVFSYDEVLTAGELELDPSNGPFMVDYNFAVLPILCGMISLFYLFGEVNTLFKKVSYNILLIIFSFSIFFSGSKRASFVLFIIIIFIILFDIYWRFKDNSKYKRFRANSFIFLISISTIALLTWITISCTSFAFKNNLLELTGSKNLVSARTKITSAMLRYPWFFNKNKSYSDAYNSIWTPVFDPKNPDSAWGTRKHKTVSHLTGNNVEIVPSGSKGYLMDNTCNPSYYPKIDICESYTLLFSLKTNSGDRIRASVFCFVSGEFNGNEVGLSIGSDIINKKVAVGNCTSIYDLNTKGIWKKLEIEFDCSGGEIPIYLSFRQNKVKNFSSLRGFVIFAYPQNEILLKTVSESIIKESDVKLLKGFKTNERKNSPILEVTSAMNDCITSKYILSDNNYASFAVLPSLTLKLFSSIEVDHDPIRRWASKFISEDTIYYPPKHNLVVNSFSNNLIDDRVSRWQFAVQIYLKEYNLRQKIFGGGFNFLNWYGFYFFNDKLISDYPHNPFLSVLLYSGILGLIFYSMYMIRVIYLYFKYFSEYKSLATFFLIICFFSLFSAGNPFDPPIMGFFTILPFFIDQVHISLKI